MVASEKALKPKNMDPRICQAPGSQTMSSRTHENEITRVYPPAVGSPVCPACRSASTTLVRTHSAGLAAEHFVPRQRSPERHARLVAHVTDLWGRPSVDVRSCDCC